MHRILIAEDDTGIATAMASALAGWGYSVQIAQDFENVLATFTAYAPQLVLMDLSLPFRSGFHWCAEIRKISSAPIIFISSSADQMDLLTALHQGADDFIAKPFDLPVLVAKVQALLRRTYDFTQTPEVLSCRGAVLNLADANLYVGETRIELTRNEFKMLELLMQNKGRVVSRDAIMRKLWDDESFIDDNTLTVNITRLRKKLEDAGLANFITTRKGLGYCLEEETHE